MTHSSLVQLTVGGRTRSFLLDMPERSRRVAALLIAAHGYGGSGRAMRGDGALSVAAHRRGVAVAYPDGLPDPQGRRNFQVGYAFQDGRVDEVEFVRAIVDRCRTRHGTGTGPVFATGMSNGGDLAYLLARALRPPVDAIAPVAGTMMCDWDRAKMRFARTRVFAVHGTDDPTTRWNGDIPNADGWGPYLGVHSVVAAWVGALGLERRDPAIPGGSPSVLRDRWWTRRDASQFVLTTRLGGGHDWPAHLGDPARPFHEEMLDFLLA